MQQPVWRFSANVRHHSSFFCLRDFLSLVAALHLLQLPAVLGSARSGELDAPDVAEHLTGFVLHSTDSHSSLSREHLHRNGFRQANARLHMVILRATLRLLSFLVEIAATAPADMKATNVTRRSAPALVSQTRLPLRACAKSPSPAPSYCAEVVNLKSYDMSIAAGEATRIKVAVSTSNTYVSADSLRPTLCSCC